MKTFIIVCLAALAAAAPDADPKADPWVTYRNYYTGYPYNTYGARAGFPYRANYYNYHPLGFTTYGKRDAEPAAEPEADPKADPWVPYSGLHYPLAYSGLHNAVAYNGLHYPLTYGVGYPYATVPVVKPVEKVEEKTDEAEVETAKVTPTLVYGAGYPYAHYPYNYNYIHHSIGKREAEPAAEPEADPKADPWVSYSGLHYPLAYNGLHNAVAYNGLHYPLTYRYPYTTVPVVKPVEKVEEKTDEAEAETAKVTPTLVYGAGYPYTHYPYNYNYIHHSIGKREAEPTPEADPWTLYSGYFNGAYPYRAASPYYNTYNSLYHYGAHPYYNLYGR